MWQPGMHKQPSMGSLEVASRHREQEQKQELSIGADPSSVTPLLKADPIRPAFGKLKTTSSQSVSDKRVDVNLLFRKLNWRLLPLFWCMVVLNYVDRTNLAFAAIQLNEDLEFGPQTYGLGSGLFFLTYATLQVPSNIILRFVGGPRWLAFIIACWGVCAAAFAGITTKAHFFALRALLGMAEAGAFPGMWFILNKFYPPDRITFAFAVVESGVALSHTIAAPMAAGLLSLDGVWGLRGWQWLFVMEGLPSVILAVVMLNMLPSSPEEATFLTPLERQYLISRVGKSQALGDADAGPGGGANGNGHLASSANGIESGPSPREKEVAGATATSRGSTGGWLTRMIGAELAEAVHAAYSNKYVWFLASSKVLKDMAGFGVIFFTPMVIQALLRGEAVGGSPVKKAAKGLPTQGHDPGVQAALLTSVPFAIAALATLAVAHHSQREGEKVLHMALPPLVCGLLFSAFPVVAPYSGVAAFVCLCFGVVGVCCGAAPGLALISELAAGPGLLVALPLYNSLGNLGGFIGPFIIGALLASTHSFAWPTALMGQSLAMSGALVIVLLHHLPRPKLRV